MIAEHARPNGVKKLSPQERAKRRARRLRRGERQKAEAPFDGKFLASCFVPKLPDLDKLKEKMKDRCKVIYGPEGEVYDLEGNLIGDYVNADIGAGLFRYHREYEEKLSPGQQEKLRRKTNPRPNPNQD